MFVAALRGSPPLRGLRGHAAGTMTQLYPARRVGSSGSCAGSARSPAAELTASYLGTQFGEEPSISQVANRFMGTGLFRAPLPKLSRPLRSAMVPDCPTPSCGSVRGSAGPLPRAARQAHASARWGSAVPGRGGAAARGGGTRACYADHADGREGGRGRSSPGRGGGLAPGAFIHERIVHVSLRNITS